MKRRWLALFLSFAMIFSLTVSAYAENYGDGNISHGTSYEEDDESGSSSVASDSDASEGQDSELQDTADEESGDHNSGDTNPEDSSDSGNKGGTDKDNPSDAESGDSSDIGNTSSGENGKASDSGNDGKTEDIDQGTDGAGDSSETGEAETASDSDATEGETTTASDSDATKDACKECGLTEGHSKECSKYVPQCTCGAEDGNHAEGCELYEAPVYSEICQKLLAADSLTEMHAIMFHEANESALMALSDEEVILIAERISELYTDEEDELEIAMMEFLMMNYPVAFGLPAVLATVTWGADFKGGDITTGTYKLVSNITLDDPISIAKGSKVTIDLNGYVLSASGDQGERVIVNHGELIITDSNGTKAHYGKLTDVETLITVKHRNELNYGSYPEGYTNEVVKNVLWKYTGETSKDNANEKKILGGVITGGLAAYGGAILNSGEGATLCLEAGTIVGNHAYRTVRTDNAATPENPVNYGYGGGVYTASGGEFTMTGGRICYNVADGGGGGVRSGSAGTFYMESGRIDHNVTNANGGGIDAYGGTYRSTCRLGSDNDKEYQEDEDTIPVIEHNLVLDTNLTGNGGGVHVQTADLYYNAGIIQYNETRGSGAGIYAYKGANVEAQSKYCIIQYNKTPKSGGGVMQQYGTVSLNESIIRYNEAGNGGGINIRVGDFEMTNGIVHGNKATGNGGGVLASAQNNITPHYDPGNLDCDVTIRGGDFTENESGTDGSGDGGGIYISVANSTENCDVTIYGGNFSGNKTAGNGGGIYLHGGTLTISEQDNYETIVANNHAAGNGGAAYIRDMVSTTSYHVEEDSHNSTVNKDGYSEYYTKETPGIVTISGGDIYGNSATDGGAIYLNNGTFTMNGGTLGTEVEGIACGNTATNNGVGVYISGGVCKLDEGSVCYNAAQDNGGAFYITNTSVDLGGDTGITIKENTATNGAGLYITQTMDAEDDFITTITNGVIMDNKASQYGGGIYHTGEYGSCTVSGDGSIRDNTAANGGGIYVTEGSALTVAGGMITGNYAKGTPDSEEALIAGCGVGGGIYIAEGSQDKQSKFTLQVTNINDQGQVEKLPVGLYGNTADFAAADAYAHGLTTTLNLPAVNDMELNLEGEEKKYATGWFADYSNKVEENYPKNILAGNNPGRYEFAKPDNVEVTEEILMDNQTTYYCLTIGTGYPGYGKLDITKKLTKASNSDEIFFFNINGKQSDETTVDLTVTITIPAGQTEGSVSITHLQDGNYTIVEKLTDWRYEIVPETNSQYIIEVNIDHASNSVTFTNQHSTDPGKDLWLDDDAYCKNVFRKEDETTIKLDQESEGDVRVETLQETPSGTEPSDSSQTV